MRVHRQTTSEMASLHQSKQNFMRARYPSRFSNEHGDVGELLPDEQDELALKIRYGIGMDQLNAIADRAPAMPPRPRRFEPRPRSPALPTQRSDAEIRTHAASLGIAAGRRGQWLRR